MQIRAKRIYWMTEEPSFYFGDRTPSAGQSFAMIVVVGGEGWSQLPAGEIRAICPSAPSDDILVGVVRKESEFKGRGAAQYSTILSRGDYAGWEQIEGRPDFL